MIKGKKTLELQYEQGICTPKPVKKKAPSEIQTKVRKLEENQHSPGATQKGSNSHYWLRL